MLARIGDQLRLDGLSEESGAHLANLRSKNGAARDLGPLTSSFQMSIVRHLLAVFSHAFT